MELEKLEKLKVLLIEWQSEYPFTHEHKETINKIIEWVINLITGKNKEIKAESKELLKQKYLRRRIKGE